MSDDNEYILEKMKCGNCCIIIPSLPIRETIYVANEYILNDKNIIWIKNIIPFERKNENINIKDYYDIQEDYIIYRNDKYIDNKITVKNFIIMIKNIGKIYNSMYDYYKRIGYNPEI